MSATGTAFEAVDGVLWQVRDALEELACQLEHAVLAAAAGGSRWRPRIARRAGSARLAVDDLEPLREEAVARLAEELGVPADTDLAGLVRAAPAPHAAVLDAHREALVAVIAAVAAEGRRLAALTEAPRAAPGTSGGGSAQEVVDGP